MSTNQINQSVNQLVNQSVDQSVDRPVDQPIMNTNDSFHKKFWNSYSLNLIVDWLETKDLTPPIRYVNSGFSGSLVRRTGLQIRLNNKLVLSVQTDPNTAGSYFAETALIGPKKITYDDSLGYSDVVKHETPEDLFKHIDYLFEEITIRGSDYFLSQPESETTINNQANDDSDDNTNENTETTDVFGSEQIDP